MYLIRDFHADGGAIIYLNVGDAFATAGSLAKLVSSWQRDQYRWITSGKEVQREDETLFVYENSLGNLLN